MPSGISIDIGIGVGGGLPINYEAETVALLARMSVQPDAARVVLINNAVKALKEAGLWAKLEILYFIAAHDAQAARLNWKSSNFTLAAVNSPVFTVDRGYAGDGSASYLNTNWNPLTSVLYTQNSASLGTWANAGTNVGNNAALTAGATENATSSSLICPRSSTNTLRGRVNAGASTDYDGLPQASITGLTSLSRTASNIVNAYRDAVAATTSAATSTLRANLSLYLLGNNNAGVVNSLTNHRLAFAFAGAGLSGAEMLSLYTIVNTYLTAVGGN